MSSTNGQPVTPLPGSERERSTPEPMPPPPGNPGATVVTSSTPPGVAADGTPPEVLTAPPSAKLGRFIRVSRLGSGGMGDVYKSWDPNLRRWVALKVLRAGHEDIAPWFLREARLAAQLQHPGLVGIHEIGQEGERLYIAMQYVEGRTLDRMGQAPRELLVRLVRDAAAAIGYAHEQGIVHRDLKPENLIVESKPLAAEGGKETWDHRVCVLDFGVARALGSERLTATPSAIGTPLYMAPEQARGEAPLPPGDVYSLGATLYECLVGAPPIRGATVNDTLRLLQTREPVPLRAIDPSISAELAGVVHKCIEKDPRDRYANGTALAEDLGRYLEGKPVTAATTGRVKIALRRLARRWKFYGAIGLGAAALAGVVATVAILAAAARAAEHRAARARGLTAVVERTRNRALDSLAQGDAAVAKAALDEAAAACRAELVHGELAEAHYFLGELSRDASDPDAAEREYTKALDLDPAFDDARLGRGLARVAKRQELRRAILAHLGGVLPRQGIAPGATQTQMDAEFPELLELRKGIAGDLATVPPEARLTREADLALARAFYFQLNADNAGAENALGPALRLPRPSPGFLAGASSIALDAGDAAAAFERSALDASLWPGSWPARLARAEASIASGAAMADNGKRLERLRLGKAEAIAAEKLGAPRARVMISRAEAALLLGEPEEAEVALTAAIEADPEDLQSLLIRAKVRADLGRKGDAAADYESALTKLPEGSPLRGSVPILIQELRGQK